MNKNFKALTLIPLVDHIKLIVTIISLTAPGKKEKNILVIREAKFTGKRQYPRRQIHCIRDKWPPNNLVFKVIMSDPIHIITKTVVNTSAESFFEVIESILIQHKIINYNPRKRHITKGPHKSHCFNSLTFSSLTYGTTTTLNFR